MFKRATNFLYDFILRNNIKIYEYLPSNLHAKVATVDGKWSTIGSYNLNHLSDYGSVEMNADILDSRFCSDNLRNFFLKSLKKIAGRLHSREYSRRKTWFFRLARLVLLSDDQVHDEDHVSAGCQKIKTEVFGLELMKSH